MDILIISWIIKFLTNKKNMLNIENNNPAPVQNTQTSTTPATTETATNTQTTQAPQNTFDLNSFFPEDIRKDADYERLSKNFPTDLQAIAKIGRAHV